MSVTLRPVLWSGIEVEGSSWSGTVCNSIIIIAGNLNAVRYREDILLPYVVPFLQAHPEMTLQHDNGTSHTARSVHDFLQDRNVGVLPWPVKSPDLNPIEHIWDLLDWRVRARAIPPQKCLGTCRCLGGRVG